MELRRWAQRFLFLESYSVYYPMACVSCLAWKLNEKLIFASYRRLLEVGAIWYYGIKLNILNGRFGHTSCMCLTDGWLLWELQNILYESIARWSSAMTGFFYFQIREEQFRRLSESTATRVNRWSIGQAVVLACISFWQMRHLRSFFKAKKLV